MEVIKPLKVCRDCYKQAYTEEDLQDFCTDSAQPLGKQHLCNACKSIRGKTRDRKNRYGITDLEYETAMSTSDSCECCGVKTNLCYDHDHTLSKNIKSFRGVLCKKCNYGIGLLGDTQEGVENALKYFLTRGNNKSH